MFKENNQRTYEPACLLLQKSHHFTSCPRRHTIAPPAVFLHACFFQVLIHDHESRRSKTELHTSLHVVQEPENDLTTAFMIV
jgi:hypothetical protein